MTPGDATSSSRSTAAADSATVSTRRINAAAGLLRGDPDDTVRVLAKLADAELHNVAEVIMQLQRQRAVASGDLDALVADAFETGFGSDGLGHPPWIAGNVIVCPGAIISKNRTSHRCRFVSVNDTWIWESSELISEEKRSSPGPTDGFRAVALLPVVNGLKLDVVTGRARSGMHSVDHVGSYTVRRGALVDVAQRTVTAAGMK